MQLTNTVFKVFAQFLYRVPLPSRVSLFRIHKLGAIADRKVQPACQDTAGRHVRTWVYTYRGKLFLPTFQGVVEVVWEHCGPKSQILDKPSTKATNKKMLSYLATNTVSRGLSKYFWVNWTRSWKERGYFELLYKIEGRSRGFSTKLWVVEITPKLLYNKSIDLVLPK